MAIEILSTEINSACTTTSSPRISFSYDLSQSDTVPVEQLLRSFSSSSSSNVDFNFCVHETHYANSSMADELFLDGKIIPLQMIRSKSNSCKRTQSSPTPYREDEKLHPRSSSQEEELKQQNSKSFWGGFKRSSSCGNGYARSLCPITLLSRSHSTGSSTSSKLSSSSKEAMNNQKHVTNKSSQKPPLRKNGYGYGNNTSTNNNNRVRVNPVLNLRFGSFFASNNKNKNKK